MIFSMYQSATLGYKANSSQAKDGSRNPATLKKDLIAAVVNVKPENVYSFLKMFILDVARFLGPPLKLSNLNY